MIGTALALWSASSGVQHLIQAINAAYDEDETRGFLKVRAHRLAPDRDDPRWRWVGIGSLTATALWLIGSGLFSLYAANFGKYEDTYGALGGVVVVMMMLWLFPDGLRHRARRRAQCGVAC